MLSPDTLKLAPAAILTVAKSLKAVAAMLPETVSTLPARAMVPAPEARSRMPPSPFTEPMKARAGLDDRARRSRRRRTPPCRPRHRSCRSW